MTVEQNLTPVHTAPDVDGIARVIGGVGGIRFQWDELERGAHVVRDAADELFQVWIHINQVETRLSVTRTSWDVVSAGVAAAVGAAALDGVRMALHQLAEGSSSLEEAGRGIRWSLAGYEIAEFVTRDHISHAAANALPALPYPLAPLVLQETERDQVILEGTVDGLLSRVSHAGDAAGSSFEVLEVDGESGPTYVVVIPGTEMREPGLPFGPGGVVEAKLADSEYVGDAVARALEEVGAEAGADVVIVGYSQGGMHAVNLANSGRVGEHYSVELVLTAGSPIAEEDAPAGTTFLHLAHEEDAVPALNLVPAPDRHNQVSVVLDHELDPTESAHGIDSYRQGAQAVDLSSHPSIAPATAALGAAVAGGPAKRHVFQLTRPPLIAGQPTGRKEPPGARTGREVSAPRAGDGPGNK